MPTCKICGGEIERCKDKNTDVCFNIAIECEECKQVCIKCNQLYFVESEAMEGNNERN